MVWSAEAKLEDLGLHRSHWPFACHGDEVCTGKPSLTQQDATLVCSLDTLAVNVLGTRRSRSSLVFFFLFFPPAPSAVARPVYCVRLARTQRRLHKRKTLRMNKVKKILKRRQTPMAEVCTEQFAAKPWYFGYIFRDTHIRSVMSCIGLLLCRDQPAFRFIAMASHDIARFDHSVV